jgi:hypothetical protein
MNDQSSDWLPDNEDDDERQRRALSLQRAFMDRARRAVEHEQAPQPRPVWHRAVAVLVALVITGTVFFAVDRFLGSMQRVMHLMDEQAEREKQQEIERKKKEPMPAYVVPSD